MAESSPYGGTGWFAGHPLNYDREYALDTEHLFAFLLATQPDEYAKLGIGDCKDKRGQTLCAISHDITANKIIYPNFLCQKKIEPNSALIDASDYDIKRLAYVLL